MKVSDIYNNSSVQTNLRIEDAGSAASQLKAGDVLEGLVVSLGNTTKVEFSQLNNKEVSFDSKSVSNAYVGQTRRFEVVEASSKKLVLKDLGGVQAEAGSKGVLAARVDMSMPRMVEDFSETNGSKEKDDNDPIKRLSDEDYSELASEGFSIEQFKAERLSRAIERIKDTRAARRESVREQAADIKEEGEKIKKRAAKAVTDRYAAHQNIVDTLLAADLPITDENVNSIAGAVAMSADALRMTDNSFAYLISNELPATVSNVYRSVYTGSIKREEITRQDWDKLEPAARQIVDEAAAGAGSTELSVRDTAEGTAPQPPDINDARWFVEYGIPLNKENLIYKKELEELRDNGRTEEEVAAAAAEAIDRGEEAEDALLINAKGGGDEGRQNGNGRRPADELTARLRLEQIRLEMTRSSEARIEGRSIEEDISRIEEGIADIREQLRSFYRSLAEEIGIEPAAIADSADLAVETAAAVEEVASAPVELYRVTFETRSTITLAGLAQESGKLSAGMGNALERYDEGATQIRRDLGDSITKAFGNVDSLLENENLELTEANRRAVRILGHNGMEISRENIESIKFYDAKVTRMIDGMKPAMVMSMIRRGYNPLEETIDSLNEKIDSILAEEGASDEEKFSSFLVRLEENNEITEEARASYVGIYRLLYQIEKSDGAAIGAAVNSGRTLTLKNLLTEARSRRSAGIDAQIDDSAPLAESVFVNSITDQIEKGFSGYVREQAEYTLRLAREVASQTDPAVWDENLKSEEAESMTLEQLAERLRNSQDSSDESAVSRAAANIRNLMGTSSSAKRFLKSLGIPDSMDNLQVIDSEGEDLSLEYRDRDSLLQAVSDPEALNADFDRKAEEVLDDTEKEFLGNIAIISKGRELDENLKKYGLLRDMARSEHFRMSTADTPARINLTLIHSTAGAGTVSLEVSTTSYHVRADLSLTIYENSAQPQGRTSGKIDGRISCDSSSELEAMATPLSSFLTAMKEAGFDTSDIGTGIDRISPDSYLSRLGELKRRAQAVTAEIEETRRKPATIQLYNIAKEFIANFI